LGKRLTDFKLKCPEHFEEDPGLTCCISVCGHYGFVGRASGSVHMYFMQNGRHNGIMGRRKEGTTVKSPVRGVFVTANNAKVVVVYSTGEVLVYSLLKKDLLNRWKVDSNVTKATWNQNASLLAVVTTDLSVEVYDAETQRIVRRFKGHKNQISDLSFSPNGNWILTSSMDRTVRVFDLPSSTLIDWFRFSAPVTSMSMTPTDEFLVTTHSGKLGIFVWVNKCHFSSFLQKAPLKPLEIDPIDDDEEESSESSVDSSSEEEEEDMDNNFGLVEIEQVHMQNKDLVMLSGCPQSSWKNLLH